MAESLEKRIDRLCKLVGRTPDELQRSGEWVLGLAGDVCRDTSLYADDTVEDLCSDSFESDEYRKMSEGLVRLEFFASEMTRQKYHAEISEIMSTAWMLKVLEVLNCIFNYCWIRRYIPDNLRWKSNYHDFFYIWNSYSCASCRNYYSRIYERTG